jgi:hypothetical protein
VRVTGDVAVGFRSPTKAIVSYDVRADSHDEHRFGTALLFTSFAIRQLVSDRGISGQYTAHMLAQTSDSIEDLLDCYGWGEVEPLNSSPGPTRKGFKGRLQFDEDDGLRFVMNPYGFGLLGKGIAYYSPHAVQLLLLRLLLDYRDDEEFVRKLAACADNAGAMFKVISVNVRNQLEVSAYIAYSICVEKKELTSPSDLYSLAVRTEPSHRDVARLMQVWQKVAAKG